MQPKTLSLIEVSTNLIGGLLVSIYLVQPLVFSYFNIALDIQTNWAIAIIFTLVSFVRSYIVRRLFNLIKEP